MPRPLISLLIVSALLTALFPRHLRSQASNTNALAPGHIEGVILSPHGEPVSRASVTVQLQRTSGTPPFRASVFTGSDGRFVVANVPAGVYRICVQAPGTALLNPCAWSAAPPSAAVTSGQIALLGSIRLETGYVVKVRLQDAGRLLQADEARSPAARVQSGLWTPAGFFIPMRVRTRGPASRELELPVPFGTSLELSVGSAWFDLAPEDNAQIDRAGARSIPIQASPGAPSIVYTFHVMITTSTATLRKIPRLPVWITAIFFSAVSAAAQLPPQTSGYLPLHRVSSVSQRFLLAAGSRLRRPGKERVAVSGVVRRDQDAASPIEITWEIPQKIRIAEAARIFVFDGANPAPNLPRDQQVADLMETFIEDSIEAFFIDQPGRSFRFVGSGFRDRRGGLPDTSYEIIELWVPSGFRNGSQMTVKQYWFDARSKFLSRVIYHSTAARGSGLIEVLWNDWRNIQGERVPFSVERKEAGRTTFQLNFSSAVVSAKADDGRFSGR